jgi:prepilin-type N-terminal cleavage/methylation domain-containing protein
MSLSQRLRRQTQNQSGFTLIELMIASVMLVSGVIVFAVFSGNLVQKNAKLERTTLATTLAQEQIEQLKNLASSAVITSANSGTDVPATGLNRAWTVSGGANTMSTITVVVWWDSRGGTTSVSLTTNLRQY